MAKIDVGAYGGRNVASIVNDTGNDLPALGKQITVSGTYRVKVKSSKFHSKDKTEVYEFPSVGYSTNKGALMLKLMFEVVDGTESVRKGDTIISQITLLPAPSATDDIFEKVIRFSKPQLFAMTGCDDIRLSDPDWLEQYLTCDFEEKGNRYEITRDHKMTKEVMISVDDDLYNGKAVLRVTSISPAKSGDHSFSNKLPEGDMQKKDMDVNVSDDASTSFPGSIIDIPAGDIEAYDD